MDTIRYPLKSVCSAVLKIVKKAEQQRDKEFGQYARETEGFFDAEHNFMWRQEYAQNEQQGFLRGGEGVNLPTFMLQINKINDAVDHYGPALIHQYPVHDVVVNNYADVDIELLVEQGDPEAGQMASQLEQADMYGDLIRENTARVSARYLDWLQVETNKMAHSRRAVTDMIVSGIGLLYHEFASHGDYMCPRSRFIHWSQYNKDPDAKTPEDVEWISITWCSPVNRVEEKFGLAPGTIKGNRQSSQTAATASGRAQRTQNRKGESYDLIEYTEWYSKNGCGQRLKDVKINDEGIKGLLESFGDYCYLAVAEDVPFPLNLPTEAIATESDDELLDRAGWPVPYHIDTGTNEDWPVSEFYFKCNPKSKWPVSLFKPLIGPIRFVNWCLSWLADKAAASSVEYIGVLKGIADSMQEQLAEQTGPFRYIKVDSTFGSKISDLVSFIGKPQFDGALMEMAQTMMNIIDKGSGLTEIMYGMSSRQMRSAKEAEVMGENATIRLDDLAEKADAWMSLAAKKEWLTAVFLSEPEEIAKAIGPKAGVFFERYIAVAPFESAARDYSYRIVAGSARKPNKQQRLTSLNSFAQVGMPMMQELLQLGIPDPYNAFIEEWAKASDVKDFEKFTIDSERLQQAIQARQQQQEQPEQADPESEDRNQQRLRQREEVHAQRMQHSAESAQISELKTIQDMINDQRKQQIEFAKQLAGA